ncbi:ZIP family metal transporter [Candidatus Micrarchaeota archaeon]|nr:ZIP family metal transporter [Candidatus Micrarchaeota archaeon]
MVLGLILLATIIVSTISLVGILTLSINDKKLHSMLKYLVSFSAGALIAAAFFDLLPEALEITTQENALLLTLIGIVSFFIVEKFLYWHHHHEHHHEGEELEQPFTKLNLIGDGIHNFVDGSIIAASFIQSTELGIISSLAIIAHEIPQEIGDYSLLIYGGLTKKKALFYNFLTALTAIIGALLTFFFSDLIPNLLQIIIPIAAGHFIYIACADLVPEMHKEKNTKHSIIQFAAFSIGIILIFAITHAIPE